MAVIEQTRTVVPGSFIGGRIQSYFVGVVGSIVAWNDTRLTRNALSKLSNHELEDIGLCRGDIEAM